MKQKKFNKTLRKLNGEDRSKKIAVFIILSLLAVWFVLDKILG